MKLYFKYIRLLLKSQLQYPFSFAMTVLAQFIQPFALFAGIYFLLARFGSIDGWDVYQVFLCSSVIGACFALSTCFARGFDTFATLVRTAGFDRILVRPRNTILQVLGANFDIKRIGHLFQALLVLGVAIVGVDIDWSPVKVLLLLHMLLGGTMIFTGVYILEATAAFWTLEGLEAANILTHGVKEHASYPLSIFPKWIKIFLTFVVPFGTVNYLPLEFLLGKTQGNPWFYVLMPLLGGLFIFPCLLFWQYGVRKYCSAGS